MKTITLQKAKELANSKKVELSHVKTRHTFIGDLPHTVRAFYAISVVGDTECYSISKKTALYLSETYNIPIR